MRVIRSILKKDIYTGRPPGAGAHPDIQIQFLGYPSDPSLKPIHSGTLACTHAATAAIAIVYGENRTSLRRNYKVIGIITPGLILPLDFTHTTQR